MNIEEKLGAKFVCLFPDTHQNQHLARGIVIWISSEFTMLLNLFLFIIIYYFRSLFPLILSSFPCSTHTIGVNNIEC